MSSEEDNVLTGEQVKQGLSVLAKTFDGSSYAYSSLSLTSLGIKSMGDCLRLFTHLRNLNISKNNLKELDEVLHLPYLVTLDASENQVASLSFLNNVGDRGCLKYLEVLKIEKNQIKELVNLYPLNRLKKLFLADNQITSCAKF